MYNLSLYRSWFPHIQTGKIWLNHAAISPLSTRVRKVIDEYLTNRSEGDIDVFASAVKASIRTKENIGRMINAPSDRIAFALNTSEGLNILASGLEWQTGDRIILNDIEFPTNIVPFLNLKRLGVEIDFVKNKDGKILTEDIEALITPRTKILSISFVQFLTGFKADLNTIGEVCKKHGIIFCVDSIQGLGASPLDIQTAQIDFLSNGGNKWLMGLMGLGFVYVSKNLQDRLHQRHAGWTSNRDFFGNFFNYRIDFDETARRYENGTLNSLAITALGESTSTLLEVGIENIEKHLTSLTDRIVSYADSVGFELISPREHSQRAGIITVKVNNAEKIFNDLLAKNIVVSLREGMLRIAPHFYSSDDEIDTLCSSLSTIQESTP